MPPKGLIKFTRAETMPPRVSSSFLPVAKPVKMEPGINDKALSFKRAMTEAPDGKFRPSAPAKVKRERSVTPSPKPKTTRPRSTTPNLQPKRPRSQTPLIANLRNKLHRPHSRSRSVSAAPRRNRESTAASERSTPGFRPPPLRTPTPAPCHSIANANANDMMVIDDDDEDIAITGESMRTPMGPPALPAAPRSVNVAVTVVVNVDGKMANKSLSAQLVLKKDLAQADLDRLANDHYNKIVQSLGRYAAPTS